MKTKFINLIFVIIFSTIIFIPNLHFSQAEISEEENRMLAKYIPFIYGGKINWNYGLDFDKFYNDRFFCREILIKFNTLFKSRVSLMQKYEKNSLVLQGQDEWLFYRGDNSEANFLNYSLFYDIQLENGLKYLKDIKTWCDKNGKVFVFLICPDKNKIYGEYYPENYKKIRLDTNSRTFQFINYVRENSDISIVYPYNELILEKSSGRILYYKNDTHWNYDGAYIGYKELIKEIQKQLDIEQVVNDEFEETKMLRGDLNKLFPEYKSITDEATVYYKPKIDSTYKNITKGNTERNFLHTVCENKNYNAIFFRDSFCTALSEFTSNTFSEVAYYWRYNITKNDLEYIKNNIDVVVLECVERYLPSVVAQVFPQMEQ